MYWRPGLTNAVGPACGLQALKYISYSAQVLTKSSKMIPVMIMGTILHAKSYTALEYTCCALISAGISLFALRSSSKVTSKLALPNAPLGYSLCAVNLILDGYTNAAQDEIHRKYPGGSALHMMAWMNFWCGLFFLPFLFGLSNAGVDMLGFCIKYPEVEIGGWNGEQALDGDESTSHALEQGVWLLRFVLASLGNAKSHVLLCSSLARRRTTLFCSACAARWASSSSSTPSSGLAR